MRSFYSSLEAAKRWWAPLQSSFLLDSVVQNGDMIFSGEAVVSGWRDYVSQWVDVLVAWGGMSFFSLDTSSVEELVPPQGADEKHKPNALSTTERPLHGDGSGGILVADGPSTDEEEPLQLVHVEEETRSEERFTSEERSPSLGSTQSAASLAVPAPIDGLDKEVGVTEEDGVTEEEDTEQEVRVTEKEDEEKDIRVTEEDENVRVTEEARVSEEEDTEKLPVDQSTTLNEEGEEVQEDNAAQVSTTAADGAGTVFVVGKARTESSDAEDPDRVTIGLATTAAATVIELESDELERIKTAFVTG